MRDHRQAVVGEDTLCASNRGQYPFWSATKTGKEVGLNKAGEDFDIGLVEGAVDADRVTVAGLTQIDQVGVIKGIVLETAVVINDGAAQHFAQFRIGLGAMGAQRVEQRDILARDPSQL